MDSFTVEKNSVMTRGLHSSLIIRVGLTLIHINKSLLYSLGPSTHLRYGRSLTTWHVKEDFPPEIHLIVYGIEHTFHLQSIPTPTSRLPRAPIGIPKALEQSTWCPSMNACSMLGHLFRKPYYPEMAEWMYPLVSPPRSQNRFENWGRGLPRRSLFFPFWSHTHTHPPFFPSPSFYFTPPPYFTTRLLPLLSQTSLLFVFIPLHIWRDKENPQGYIVLHYNRYDMFR